MSDFSPASPTSPNSTPFCTSSCLSPTSPPFGPMSPSYDPASPIYLPPYHKKARSFYGSFHNRFMDLFLEDKHSDCEFIVGKENVKIRGHKLLFAIASDVFDAMFYGDLKEDSVVVIKDLDPVGFQCMKQFIYTNKVKLSCIYQARSTFIAAEKYLIPQLRELCARHIYQTLLPSQVIRLYEECKEMNTTGIVTVCENFIRIHTEKVLKCDNFLAAEPATVDFILKCPLELNLPEIYIFEYFEKWAHAEAGRRNIPKHDIQSSFNNLKKHIRFLLMNKTEFATRASKSALLTENEKLAIALNIMHYGSVPYPDHLSCNREPRNFGY